MIRSIRTIKSLKAYRLISYKEYNTPFGPIINIRPFPRKYKKENEGVMTLLSDQSPGKVMDLIEKKKTYFIFDNTFSYKQSVNFHNSLKQRFVEKYSGTYHKPKDFYKDSKTKLQQYLKFRGMLFQISESLSHIGYHMFPDGTIDVTKEPPTSKIIKDLIEDWKLDLPSNPNPSLKKPDYYISLPLFHEALHADDLTEGIEHVSLALNEQIIKASYGVAMPSQTSAEMFSKYISAEPLSMQNIQKGLELYANTGLFSLMLGVNGVPEMYSIDKNKYSIKSILLNAEAISFPNPTIIAPLLVKDYTLDEINKIDPNGMYDVMVSFPPFLHTPYLKCDTELVNQDADPEGKLLLLLFDVAEQKLSNEGRLFLFFSNLGEEIGLCEKNLVEKLCQKYNMKITAKIEEPLGDIEFIPEILQPVVEKSKLVFFDIRKRNSC